MEMQFRDWYFWITRTYVTAIKCIVDGYTLRQLGRLQRAFKPEIPFTIYVSFNIDSFQLIFFRRVEITE